MIPKLAACNIHKVGALVARKRNIAELRIILSAAIGRGRSVGRGKHGLYRKCGFGGVFRLRTGRSPALSDFGSSLQRQNRNEHHKCKQQSSKHSELCFHCLFSSGKYGFDSFCSFSRAYNTRADICRGRLYRKNVKEVGCQQISLLSASKLINKLLSVARKKQRSF